MDADDIKVEPEVGAEGEDPEGEERAEGKMQKLREELKNCRAEKQEYMDGWQRSKADYVNLLKRIQSDGKMLEQKGRIDAVMTLLPALDALERAEEHGDIPQGFQAIAKQLASAFSALGLSPLGEVGERFNPAVHEALGQDKVDVAEQEETITAVLEKGWQIGDRVIRPAKVRVAHLG